MRQVVLYQDEDGNWIAEVPSLPGCRSDGDTPDSALENVKEAIAGMIAFMKERGMTIPEEPGTARLVDLDADDAAA